MSEAADLIWQAWYIVDLEGNRTYTLESYEPWGDPALVVAARTIEDLEKEILARLPELTAHQGYMLGQDISGLRLRRKVKADA